MAKESDRGQDELARLRARVDYLEEANRFTLDALSMAARLGDFQPAVGTLNTPESILAETARRVGELVQFSGMLVMLVDDDTMELVPGFQDRPELEEYFLAEFERLAEENTIAWVLQRRQPTFVSSGDGERQLLLHSVRTADKTLGLFMGRVDEEQQDIFDSSLAILSIVLLNSANTLDNLALRKARGAVWRELEVKVEELGREVERRKQSEFGLESTRNFLNEVINTVPEPIFVKDQKHRFLMVNDAFCFFTDKTREALVGMTSYDIFPREEADVFHRKDAKVMMSGKSDTHEGVVHTPDGVRHDVSVKKASLMDPETGENVLVGIIRNLTDKKNAERLLLMERELFFGLLEHLPGFIYVQGADYAAEYANKAFRELFGEYEGKRCYEVFHDEQGVCEECPTLGVTQTGQPTTVEKVYGDGRTYQVSIHPFDDPDGTRKVLIMGIDITDRNKAVEALAESEAKYRELVQSANSIIIRWTRDGLLTFFNEFAESFFGFSNAEVVGRPMVGTIVPEVESTGRPLAPLMEEITAYPTAFTQNENENIRSDGKRVWVSWSNRGVYDDEGNLTEILSVGTDITDRVFMEKELRKAKRIAEDASRAKSEFLANTSHEIRTPLNGVLGMLQLASATAPDGELNDYIETALESGRSLLTVINDILDVSKIEAGKFDIAQTSFSPRQVVESVVRTFAHQSKETGIVLTSEIGESVPEVLVGDGGRIRQVLFNLVGNSMKFTNGGTVSVSIHVIRGQSDALHRLLFMVQDTGIGIPDDKVDYIFDAFTQVDGSYHRKYQGSGLGLGIVKRLVHLMHGTITIDTEEGHGTTIAFALDMEAPQGLAEARSESLIDGDFDPSAIHVLLAEDNRVNQIMARKSLEKAGFTVNCVENGAEALNALDVQDYGCILLDVQMPVMDGLETTRRIRDGEAGVMNKGVPIIALTAHAMTSDRERFLAAGMDDVLAKPYDVDELFEAIRNVLSGSVA